MRLVYCCFLFFATLAANADSSIPNRVFIEFKIVTSGIVVGEGTEVFQRAGKNYEVKSTTKPRGIASLFLKDFYRQSKGKIAGSNLIPSLYEEKGKKSGSRIAKFNWNLNQVHLKNRNKDKRLHLPLGTIDQASFLFSFMLTPPKQKFQVHIADGKRLKKYTYKVIGSSIIKSPKGPLNSVIIKKSTDDRGRQLEVWLATDLYYLPVKIKYTDKRERVFESILSNIVVH